MRKLPEALVAMLLTGLVMTALGGGAAARAEEQRGMFYVVVAHPDDEIKSWPMIASRSDDYLVFVILTQGEGTYSCMTHEQARKEQDDTYKIAEEATMVEGFTGVGFRSGAYRYQGPESPVGEPDDKERRPLGDPWVGQGTPECAAARIASWHWFLDEMNKLDGAGTDMEVADDPRVDDDYQGRFCLPGHQGKGDRRPIEKQIGCVEVWANEDGARVAFDLGNPAFDGTEWPEPVFGVEETTAALQSLREERAEWGLPVLPETGMLAASPYSDSGESACAPYRDPHPEHALVQEALRYVDQDAGPQYGVSSCPADDPYAEGAVIEVVVENAATVIGMNLIDPITEERIGPVVKAYGWLWDTYTFQDGIDTYWKVFD